MMAAAVRTYRLGEFHPFEGGGRKYVYLPAGAIFEIDGAAAAALAELSNGPVPREELLARTGDAELIDELFQMRVIEAPDATREPLENPPADFPLQSLVMNLTNQCNLSCQYCYEFGEDKVATPEGKPKFMDIETARASVDFLLAQSAGRKSVFRPSPSSEISRTVRSLWSFRRSIEARRVEAVAESPPA